MDFFGSFWVFFFFIFLWILLNFWGIFLLLFGISFKVTKVATKCYQGYCWTPKIAKNWPQQHNKHFFCQMGKKKHRLKPSTGARSRRVVSSSPWLKQQIGCMLDRTDMYKCHVIVIIFICLGCETKAIPPLLDGYLTLPRFDACSTELRQLP